MIGQTVSHYRIVEKLGEGGMGVVYKAQDTELNRFVALKALPTDTASDPERRARFLREAQAASGLNHPNIVTIHDILRRDEGDFIVMELVAGRTLDELIPRSGMRLGEALKHAIQVASALEAAHEAGIVHRDLKPANIMVGDDGRVRVLDFGLAKLRGPVEGAGEGDDEGSTRATEAAPRTREGQIIGTVSYMSPEQAEGRDVDARADIFSFGCVLYEMVTGQRPFGGGSRVSTLAAVIKEDPKPLPSDVPDELQRLIERCLRKDPERRMRHMDDVRLTLQDMKEESDSGTLKREAAVTAARSARRRGWTGALVSAAVVVAVAGGVWLGRTRTPEPPAPAMREVPFTSDPGVEAMGRFSPDGSTVVFVRWPEDFFTFGTTVAKVIGAEGTQVLRESGGQHPVYSPDGRWIAVYVCERLWAGECGIFVMSRIGGEERLVAEVDVPLLDRGVSWTPDGQWLLSPDREGGEGPFHITLISVQTGEKRRLTTPPADIVGDLGPALTPDGRTLAFARQRDWGESGLYLLSLDAEHRPAGEPRPLTHDVPQANSATWTPDGREIVFCSGAWHAASLWRVAADGETPPRPLGVGGRGAYLPDIDPTGSRLLYTKHTWDLNVWQLDLLPSGGAAREPRPLLQSTLIDGEASFSPGGEWIAFTSERSGSREIWLSDRSGSRLRQLTSLGSAWGMTAVWSPDGEWIAFNASVGGRRDVYVVRASGGAPVAVASDPVDWIAHWSEDGERLYYESGRGGSRRFWSVPRGGGEATPVDGEPPWGVADPTGAFRYISKETPDGWSIRRRGAGGGPAETIIEGGGSPSMAVSTRGVYFAQREPAESPYATHIAFLDLASGETRKVVELRPGFQTGWSISVSPDESTLLYTQCDAEGDGDLMLVENFR